MHALHRSFGHSPTPTFVCARSGEIIYRNDAAARRSAPIAPHQVGADSLLALVAPDQRAHVAQALSGLTANAPAVALETPLHLEPAGIWKLRAYLFGESDDVVVTVEPPSPAASTELSAQGSYEHRFRTMAHGVHDAIWEWDCESGAIFWHAGLHDVLGYDKGTLDPTLDAWAEHVHPDDRERVVASLHNAVEMGQSAWVEEYRFRRADGSWAQVVDRGFAIAFEGDRPTRLIGGINDVTASRQASATIRRQARLIEQTHDAIWVRDFDGIVRFWNPGAERIFGKSRENVVGRALREHESNTDTPTLEGLKRRGSWSGVVHRYDRQGNEVILEERWTLLRDEHDEPHAILIVGSDITERHHLQSQFLRIQRVESMGSVAAGIAHDLNNVLAPIHFGVEYLRGELAPGDTTLKEVLEEVAGSVHSASSMIHHILNFARGNDATREALDLHRLVSDALRIVTRGHAHRISTRIHNDAPSDRVMGVPTQIHQLLLNLCVNARDAIDGEGSIEVHLREASVTPEQAEQNPDARPGDYLRIDVRDNGRGMSADVIVRVFEPFYTTKGVNQGTGIGLSTSISIVRSHGGFIDVESAPGEGTLFSVFLPIAMEASRSAEPPSPSPVSPAEGRDPS